MKLRTDNTFTDEQLSELWDLWDNSVWIKENNTELDCLYSIFCEEKERAIINRLLKRFTYLSRNEAAALTNDLADKITSNAFVDSANTYLIPRSYSKSADGSKSALYQVIKALKDYSWEFANTSHFKSIISKPRDHIIVIDDFVGSGSSMIGTINWFRENLPAKDFGNISFYAYCLAGMSASIRKLEVAGYSEVYYSKVLAAGISEMSDTPDLEILDIKEIQIEKLDAEIGRMKLNNHLLGWGDAEALYYNPEYRVSNSMFPIFWWRTIKDQDSEWGPLFRGR